MGRFSRGSVLWVCVSDCLEVAGLVDGVGIDGGPKVDRYLMPDPDPDPDASISFGLHSPALASAWPLTICILPRTLPPFPSEHLLLFFALTSVHPSVDSTIHRIKALDSPASFPSAGSASHHTTTTIPATASTTPDTTSFPCAEADHTHARGTRLRSRSLFSCLYVAASPLLLYGAG